MRYIEDFDGREQIKIKILHVLLVQYQHKGHVRFEVCTWGEMLPHSIPFDRDDDNLD